MSPLLTAAQIADRAGCGQALVQNWRRDGHLPDPEGQVMVRNKPANAWTEATVAKALERWRQHRQRRTKSAVSKAAPNRFEMLWQREMRGEAE